MKALVRHMFAIPGELRSSEKIGMTLTKGVVDLGQDGCQRAICSVCVPETHRLEGIAQHAGKGMQPDFSICIPDIGDADGVVVVEREKIEGLLPAAAKKVKDEAARIEAIKGGDTNAKWLTSALRAAGVLKEGESL